jgi:GTPase
MNLNQEPIRSFEGMVSVLHHSSTIQVGYESVFHCGIVRQTVKIIDMSKQVLRTGDKDAIKFNLLFSPEII